jgi:GH25 family lysozyme M1 (1,4-beta-N-acetylmuramidase)
MKIGKIKLTALCLTAILCLAGCGSSGDVQTFSEAANGYLYSSSDDSIPADMAYKYDSSAFVLNDAGDMTYTDSSTWTYRNGIDVSSYSGSIDWDAVKNAGYEFAYLRIGYRGYESGEIKADEMFDEYYSGATAAGLDVGVYFYSQAISDEEAKEEAQFVLDTLGDREVQLPVTIDVEMAEAENARTANVSSDQYTDNVLAFSETISDAGLKTMIYTNLYGQTFMLNMHDLDGLSIWFSDFEATPNTEYTFDFWQYSNTGIVDGISGDVDLDIQMIPVSD